MLKRLLKLFLIGLRNGIVILLLIVVVVQGFSWLISPFDEREFDQTTWVQFYQSEDPNNPRGQMYDDLRKRLLKDKPDRAEVIAMLGEPDYGKSDRGYEYMLGAWSGFRIDYDSMHISFDESGRVEYVGRVQH